MKKAIAILLMCLILSSCARKNQTDIDETTIDILRTGEYFQEKQMESLKSAALSWQELTNKGVGGFANIVVIEPADDSVQQVFVSLQYGGDNRRYEKLHFETPAGAQARIICAMPGGGSGDLMLGYRFISEDSEWYEIFLWAYGSDLSTENRWRNTTGIQPSWYEDTMEAPVEEWFFE